MQFQSCSSVRRNGSQLLWEFMASHREGKQTLPQAPTGLARLQDPPGSTGATGGDPEVSWNADAGGESK